MTRRSPWARTVTGLVTASLLLVASCGGSPGTSGATAGDAGEEARSESISITDVRGDTVTVDAPPERVVCLVSLCEDLLLELGMRPVAVTGDLISHPTFLGAEGDKVPRVPGGFLEPDVEAIIGMEPDLVIGLFQAHDGLAAALDGVAPLWIIQTDSLDDSLAYLRDMGTLTGRTEQAAASEQRFSDRLAAAENAASKDFTAGVLFGLDGDFEVSTGGELSDLMGRLFTYPWEERQGPLGGSPYSLEEMVSVDPDILFVLTYNEADPDGPPLSDVLGDNPLWGQLTAAREGAVYEVDTGLWGNGRGTRSMGAVAEEALELADSAR